MSIHGQTGASWPHMPPVPPPGVPGVAGGAVSKRAPAWFKVSRREDVPTLVNFILQNQKLVLGEAMCLEFPTLKFENDAAGKKLLVDGVVLFWNCVRPVGRSADVSIGRYGVKLVCHSDKRDPPFVVQLLSSGSGAHPSAPPEFLRQNLATHSSWIKLVKMWQTFLGSAPSAAPGMPSLVVPPPVHASLTAAPWGSPLSQAGMDPRFFQDPRYLSYINPYHPPPSPPGASVSAVDVVTAQAAAQAQAAQAQAQALAVAHSQLWSQHQQGLLPAPASSPAQAARRLEYDTPPHTPQSSSDAAQTGAAVTPAAVEAGLGGKRPPSPNLTPSAAKKPADLPDIATLAQKVVALEAANAMLAEQLNTAFPDLEARLDKSFAEIRAQVAQLESQLPALQQSGDTLAASVSTISATLSSFQSDTETTLAAHRLALDAVTTNCQ